MKKEKKMKKKSTSEWFKEITNEEFKQIFAEWYIPAIQSGLDRLEDRIKKLEEKVKKCDEFRMIHDDTLTCGGPE